MLPLKKSGQYAESSVFEDTDASEERATTHQASRCELMGWIRRACGELWSFCLCPCQRLLYVVTQLHWRHSEVCHATDRRGDHSSPVLVRLRRSSPGHHWGSAKHARRIFAAAVSKQQGQPGVRTLTARAIDANHSANVVSRVGIGCSSHSTPPATRENANGSKHSSRRHRLPITASVANLPAAGGPAAAESRERIDQQPYAENYKQFGPVFSAIFVRLSLCVGARGRGAQAPGYFGSKPS